MSVVIKNISKRYNNIEVLKSISFELKKGEIVGFLGPNGAGKSTTMKIITGFLKPDFGEVGICGIDMLQNPIEAKKNIGYLPEHNPLYLDMYVREYLMFVAGFYDIKSPKNRIDEIIEQTGLTNEFHKKIGQLSKGYRQRVGLAQALIHDPKVLILDEPTTGLDPSQLVEIRNLICNLGKEKTVLLSTHIMQEVKAICDRVLIINKGQIIADKDPMQLSTQIAENRLLFEVELDKTFVEIWQNEFPEISCVTSIGTNSYRIEAERDIRSDLFKFLTSKGYVILTLKQLQTDIEDVFIELTK
ncbi:MAG: gliding motility-associated ABC transporter ATP-binding subunit GldA [Paludibacteraceae bacterium]|nr:gliding motility-associated ABC transporter ATP-binding subunit GldA [Paludibacteraceae bacterium]